MCLLSIIFLLHSVLLDAVPEGTQKKAILHHVLPLQSSLTGGNVCSRQMVLLDQDQHLLGEYFHNS